MRPATNPPTHTPATLISIHFPPLRVPRAGKCHQREHAMSDSSNNDQTAPSAGPNDGHQPDTHALSHVGSPGIAPDTPYPTEAAAPTSKIAAPETVTSAPKPPHEGAADRQP